MPVLLTQSIECTQHFNAPFSRKVSAYEAKSNGTSFSPSAVFAFGHVDFLWGMKNRDLCLGSVLGQLKVFGTMRDCNEAKTIGALNGTTFQVNEKKSFF